jgi:putative membrane protein
MSRSDNRSLKFLIWLLVAYAVLFVILAIHPVDRATWLVENLTVWIILTVIITLYLNKIIFTKTAYALMFILIYLHTIGGHWTFAMVPFDWITRLFHFSRNHFDRVAHFSVGFYAFAIAELLWEKRLVKNRFLLFTYPVFCIATIAMTYELVEWIYADLSDPAAGLAYLGSQGDIWDAQKDMLADTLGALTAVIFYFLIRKPVFEKKEAQKNE